MDCQKILDAITTDPWERVWIESLIERHGRRMGDFRMWILEDFRLKFQANHCIDERIAREAWKKAPRDKERMAPSSKRWKIKEI